VVNWNVLLSRRASEPHGDKNGVIRAWGCLDRSRASNRLDVDLRAANFRTNRRGLAACQLANLACIVLRGVVLVNWGRRSLCGAESRLAIGAARY